MSLLVTDRQAVCGKCKGDLATVGVVGTVDSPKLERAIESSPAPVLVDFWAPWCGPCKTFAPILETFAREQAGNLVVLRLDTEANQEAAVKFGVQSIPTIALFRNGREIDRLSGALPLAELRNFVSISLTTLQV